MELRLDEDGLGCGAEGGSVSRAALPQQEEEPLCPPAGGEQEDTALMSGELPTCMCKASSGCSPIRPSVTMTRFPASLDV